MLTSQSLSSYWQFITDPKDEGKAGGWTHSVPSGVRPMWVPSCWNESDERLSHYDGVAWYFKSFPLGAGDERLAVEFLGVNYRMEAWLNGLPVGTHEGGFTPFQFDVTSAVRRQGLNLLVVRVDSRMGTRTIPPAGVDWFNYGGIFREVSILSTGAAWLDDVFVQTKMSGDASVAVELGGRSSGPLTLNLSIIDPADLRVVGRHESSMNGNSELLRIRVRDCTPWSLENPHLYRFVLELLDGERLLDRWEHAIGFREFSVQGRRILLNGNEVFLRGYSKHEEYPLHARTFCRDIVRRDYEICKNGGCNFLRLSHYPHHPTEYEIASENGMLVIAEIPNLNFTREHFADREMWEKSVAQLREAFKVYKNETCILFWSLFIECRTDEPESVDFVSRYVSLARSLDPTRLLIHASIKPAEDKVYDLFDVVGINYWTGWYNGETVEEGRVFLQSVADRYPDKPVVITSGGWEAMPGFRSPVAGSKWSEESQAEYLTQVSRMYQSIDAIVGQIIWTFNDFKVMPWLDETKEWFRAWWVYRPFEMNFKGVVDFYRRPKLSYYQLADVFRLWDERAR